MSSPEIDSFKSTSIFLVGISTQVPARGVRYGLIGVGVALLVLSVVQLSALPLPPS